MAQSEKELILKFQSGDSGAFASLYDLYFDKIYRFIFYKVGHKENAEDLCSQTFTKAIENIKQLKTDQLYFSAWLYKIARNTVIDYHRSKKENLELAQDIYQENYMEEKISAKIDWEKISAKIENLPEEKKEMITMRLWDNLSYKEISQILGKSEASIKMSFSRTIKQLRESLVVLFIISLFSIIK